MKIIRKIKEYIKRLSLRNGKNKHHKPRKANAHFIFNNHFTSKSWSIDKEFKYGTTNQQIVRYFFEITRRQNYTLLSSVEVDKKEVWNMYKLYI